MVYAFAVECGESSECSGENLWWERDVDFGRCERVHASNGGFVERDGEALLDFAFPEEFEDLVGVRRKCEGSCGSSAVLLHDSFVVRHSNRIMLLGAVDEDLANSSQLVLH